MRAAIALSWRLLRRSGGRGLVMAGLSVFAVAVSTALLLLTLGVDHGFAARAGRESWLHPVAAKGEATAVETVSTDFVRGRPIAVVDLAALKGKAPAPPGMPRFPHPGEVWMSPALAKLSGELPPDQLKDRFTGERSDDLVAGKLGQQALEYPGQLIVVVGREADAPVFGPAHPSDLGPTSYSATPTRISGFAGSSPDWYVLYRALSAFATALLVIPLVVLGAAAGRLASARRERQLAAMRLVGATPGQVLAITTFETVLLGAVGAVLGALAYIASLPLAAQVSATGGTWFVSDLWVGPAVLAAMLVAAPLTVGASALVGLRKLVISPLGVARRQSPRGARVWRLILFVALLVAYGVVAPGIGVSSAVPFAVLFSRALYLGSLRRRSAWPRDGGVRPHSEDSARRTTAGGRSPLRLAHRRRHHAGRFRGGFHDDPDPSGRLRLLRFDKPRRCDRAGRRRETPRLASER